MRKCEFGNGRTTIQIGILHERLDVLSISLLLRYMLRLAISRCKNSNVILGFEEKLPNAGGQLELLASIDLIIYHLYNTCIYI